MPEARSFIPIDIAVLTVSDTRTDETDTSGRLLVSRLQADGHRLAEKVIVPDDVYRIRACVSRWIADPGVRAVVATGGTGLTGRDGTPEAIRPLLDKEIDGFGELFRSISYEEIGTSTVNSRALGGWPTAPSCSAFRGRRERAGRLGIGCCASSSTIVFARATSSSCCPG